MKLYCYSIGPIDWWHGGIPTEQMEARLRMKNSTGYTRKLDLDAIWEEAIWEEAKGLGKELGWEGDLADDAPFPVWGTIPNPDNAELGIWCAWKQENKGITFVCSTADFTRLGNFFRKGIARDTKED
jgi:hypothetical protein